jgi:hypothetical protein
MTGTARLTILTLLLLLGLSGQMCAQAQSGRPKRPSVHEQGADDLTDVKDDLAKMQSLLNHMQAVFPLVGNPTSPANHELQLNIDMWRILIIQMQRRVDRLEKANTGTSKD